MSTQRSSVLILASNPGLALAFCRALGRSGHRVSVVRLSPEKALADYSRFCSESQFLGVPGACVSRFHQKLIQRIEAMSPEWLLPAGDLAEDIAYAHFDAIARLTRIFGPEPAARARARHLIEAKGIASTIGLDCPDGLVVKQSSSVRLDLSLPRRVRPVAPSAIIDDEWQQFSEKTVHSPMALEAKLRDDLPRTDLVLEEPLLSKRITVQCVARDGTLLEGAMFSHRLASPSNQRLMESMRAAARELSWTGFLSMNLLLEKDRATFDVFRTDTDASFVASLGDMHSILERSASMGVTERPTGYHNRIGMLEAMSDPAPSLHRLDSLLSRMARQFRKAISSLMRTVRASGPPPKISKMDRLLIVCQGNINRSVVAEHLLRARAFSRVSSAALLPMSGRTPSAQAEQFLVERLSADVSSFRSRSIDQALERDPDPDLVICFEHWQVNEIIRRFPRLADRTHVITDFSGNKRTNRDIFDPHGASDDTYRRCFCEIDDVIASLAFADTPPHSRLST